MKTTEKLDLQRTDPQYYKAAKEPEAIDLTVKHYLAVAGQGDPDGAVFAQAMKALYGAAYGIKFMKKREGKDFKILVERTGKEPAESSAGCMALETAYTHAGLHNRRRPGAGSFGRKRPGKGNVVYRARRPLRTDPSCRVL